MGEVGELAAERQAAVGAISGLGLTPVLFELGARPYPPRALYRAYLAQSDIFVGLYWQRYGRVDPGGEVSGLEEEFQLSVGLVGWRSAPGRWRFVVVVFASPAGLTLGSVETTVGRYDDALRHLTEARDLAVRLDNAWLTATSQVLLGALALVQGRLEDAQALLEEALELSLAAHSTRSVTLCLTGFAQLALVQGDAERAALLAPSSTSGRQSTPSAVGPAPAPGHPERWPRCHTNQAFELVSESTRTS